MIMKKSFYLIIILICLQSVFVFAQSSQFTMILLRHAEKENDKSKDPSLSAEGRQFSQKLAAVFKETKINAVYSTSYKRTTETVEPLAEQNKLTVINYDPAKPKELLEKIRRSGDQVVVVAGHSNTIQLVFNALTKSEMAALNEDEYRKVFIIYGDLLDPVKSRYVKLDLN
ncbi:MAG: histidine phosphatase family protein [Pedobacter sp.]|nr:MAG: histidine phosphatase family protein [Pedobacter sp.]